MAVQPRALRGGGNLKSHDLIRSPLHFLPPASPPIDATRALPESKFFSRKAGGPTDHRCTGKYFPQMHSIHPWRWSCPRENGKGDRLRPEPEPEPANEEKGKRLPFGTGTSPLRSRGIVCESEEDPERCLAFPNQNHAASGARIRQRSVTNMRASFSSWREAFV